MTADTGKNCRVLLLHRGDPHVVTTGGSVLTSGDPRVSPADILAQKVQMDPAPDESLFSRFGLALSDPKKTGGIHYLFDVHKAVITGNETIATSKDSGTLVSIDDALRAVDGKPVEIAVLEQIRSAA